MRVVIDFETASFCDLKTSGAWAYAEHWSTEVLCVVWRVEGSQEFGVWAPRLPEYEDHYPLRVLACNPDVVFVSHASFEQAIWHCFMEPRLGMPALPPERWEDTQATAAWKSLPLKLEKLCQVLGLPVQKDMEGSRLTIGLSRCHKKTGMLDRRPETLRRVVDYCKTDVAGEEAALRRLGSLSAAERKVWLLDQQINQRGVRIDLDFVAQAQLVVDRASVPLAAEFRDLTGGINPGQRDKVIAWCAGQGVELENLQKGYIEGLLGVEEEDDSLAGEDDDVEPCVPVVGLPGAVRRVLEIRSMLGSASIKKLGRMVACTGADGRARGLLQYHAAGTGRWGGRLLQPQNFPRGTFGKDSGITPGIAVDAIMAGDPEHVERTLGVPAIEAVASSLRHALIADPGKVFLVGDFAGIEARIVLALAGQHDKTEAIAGGENPYFDFGRMMFGHEIDKKNLAEYIPSKAGVLGCGFQCGPANFAHKFLGGDVEMAEKVVNMYRYNWAPKVPELWGGMKEAVNRCVRHGVTVDVHGCRFSRVGEFMALDLPSGWQRLWYFAPAIRDRGDDYGMSPSYRAQKMGQFKTIFLYGGIVVENAVQALARGLLISAMGRIERAGMPIVLTVHDEVIAEVDEDKADLPRFEALMAEPTAWSEAMRIPVAVEGWAGTRYRK